MHLAAKTVVLKLRSPIASFSKRLPSLLWY
jgi:hypothetical protein